MASTKDMTLTSVKVKSDFFQKLADRSLCLYLTDEDFRKKINSQVNIELEN